MDSLNPHFLFNPRPPCHGKLNCDLQAFTLPQFTEPLRLSLLAVAAGFAVASLAGAVQRRRRNRRPPTETPGVRTRRFGKPKAIGGLFFVAAALGGFQETGHLVLGLGVAVVLLAVGGLVADVANLPLPVRMLLAVPGAVMLALGAALPGPAWEQTFAGVATVIGAGLIADLDRRNALKGFGPVLLAVTVAGLYESVPNPSFPLLLAGAGVPLALLGWPWPIARLGGGGAAAAAGFLAWTSVVGGQGRPAAVIGGFACIGLFAIEPIARLVLSKRQSVLERLPRRLWVPVVVGGVQLALAAACTRIAVWSPKVSEAGEVVGGSLVVAVALGCMLSRHAESEDEAESPPSQYWTSQAGPPLPAGQEASSH